jgi:glycosyltransferase involved in cell wall biosynthesis
VRTNFIIDRRVISRKWKIVTVQPFGLVGPGGGAKLLRSLFAGQPFECVSMCTQNSKPLQVQLPDTRELWVPLRRDLRLDRTRVSGWIKYIDPLFSKSLNRRIINTLRIENPDVVHTIPHSPYDWPAAAEYCEIEGKPLILSIHDDLRYTLRDEYQSVEKKLRKVWLQADHIFCISPELGEEYCRRFGNRKFETLTDGLTLSQQPQPLIHPARLRIYFCGLLHNSYIPNFLSLLVLIRDLDSKKPGHAKLVIRGGGSPRELNKSIDLIEYLPFVANVSEIANDFQDIDLLYLPLPFGREYDDFVNFSLSTKLISYLGSGIPILYHGPRNSALARLLIKHDAAFMLMEQSLNTSQLDKLGVFKSEFRTKHTDNAFKLAETSFRLEDMREKLCRAVFACRVTRRLQGTEPTDN